MNNTNIYIALLRGINVGSHNRIKMAHLREVLNSLGLENVQTYMQSGNVLFKSQQTNTAALANKIRSGIQNSHGFEPSVFILTLDEIKQAARANPFPEAEAEPKSLHLGFLASDPANPDIEKLNELKKDNERFELKENVFYLHAPDGVGRSKLAAGREKALGTSMTNRNWKTVQKIIGMAET